MLSKKNYKKILDYFDRQFWTGKSDETGWNYYGLILDWYFENSVYCIDYLDVEDYFDNNGEFSFSETKHFSEQYADLNGAKQLELIQAILNLINKSTVNREQNQRIISAITNVLGRDMVKVDSLDNGFIFLLTRLG